LILYFLAKPRILAPNTVGKDVAKEISAVAAPKFTVNELSAESIKRGLYFLSIYLIKFIHL
jgi:hypothetical protein